MPPPGLQIYLWPDPKVDRFMPLPVHHLCQLASESFTQFQNIVFASLVCNRRTNEQTNKRTNGQAENMMPPPACLA